MLTPEQAATIRVLWWTTDLSQVQIGNQFGITHGGVMGIVLNKRHHDPTYKPPTRKQRRSRAMAVRRVSRYFPDEEIHTIRKLWESGLFTQVEIAQFYQTAAQRINDILTGRTYQDVVFKED